MTLAANAAIDRVGVELAYDATPGITEREYFQTYVRPEQGDIAEGRVVDAEASARLFEAFHLNPEAARLFRAAGQYSHALDLWKGGDEILAVEHLWIAVEALTKVQIVSLKGATSTNTNAELAKALGVELKELDAHVREVYLLGGDADCYERARRASDGFEHAYMDFDDVHSDSVKIRDRLAKHVRASLIRLSGVGKDYEERLLASKYDQPVTYWPLVQYLHGRLIGTGENLALRGQEYPFIRWKPGVKSCEIGEDGKMQMQFTLDFTPELAEGIQFQPIRVELWRPH